MTETVLFILEIIGTAVFAASGALAGLQRQLDAFGVVILGVCTACGGGVIRDLTLGITPPVMFCQPVYALVAMGVSALVFLPAVRHLLAVESRAYELVMLWLDSIGLGLFTVVGVQCAFQQAENYNLFLLVFVGVITGVGGGVLRDVLSNQKPYIFVKHFYACHPDRGIAVRPVLAASGGYSLHAAGSGGDLSAAAVRRPLPLGPAPCGGPSGITGVCQKGLCLPRKRQVFLPGAPEILRLALLYHKNLGVSSPF